MLPLARMMGGRVQAIAAPGPGPGPDPGDEDRYLIAIGTRGVFGFESMNVYPLDKSSGIGSLIGTMEIGEGECFDFGWPAAIAKGRAFAFRKDPETGRVIGAVAFAISEDGASYAGSIDIFNGSTTAQSDLPASAADGDACFVAARRASLEDQVLVLTMGEHAGGAFTKKGNSLVVEPDPANFLVVQAYRHGSHWCVAVQDTSLGIIPRKCWFYSYSFDGSEFTQEHATDLTNLPLSTRVGSAGNFTYWISPDWSSIEVVEYDAETGFSHAGTIAISSLDPNEVLTDVGDIYQDPISGKLWISLFDSEWAQWSYFVCELGAESPAVSVVARLDDLDEEQIWATAGGDFVSWWTSGNQNVLGVLDGDSITPIPGSSWSGEFWFLWF